MKDLTLPIQVNKIVGETDSYEIWQSFANGNEGFFVCGLGAGYAPDIDITWETIDLAVCEFTLWQMRLLEESGQFFMDI